jgi:hypothetical protein
MKENKNIGKYGIIHISDVFLKRLEFITWLSEIKKINPRDLNQNSEKPYLLEYIEEFNNSKFPSKKYYNIYRFQSKEIQKALKKRKRDQDMSLLQEDMDFLFDDEIKKEKEKKFLKELDQKRRLEEAISSMSKEKAEAMKEIDFKGNLMRHYYQTGDMEAAKDIHKQYFGVKKEAPVVHENPPPDEELDDD